MAEQTFKSPGFFEREIEIIKRPIVKNDATPVGLIGPALKGPALVPTTVYSREEYIRIFGPPTRKMMSGHAAAEFFRNDGKALTFCRMLGAGFFDGTNLTNAGFSLDHTWFTPNAGVPTVDNGLYGGVNFIVAQHEINDKEHLTLGMYNDNNSHKTDLVVNGGMLEQNVELVRAMILCEKDHYIKLSTTSNDVTASQISAASGLFDLHILNKNSEVIEKLTISLNPDSSSYISKVLNTDPLDLSEKKIYLLSHFPVDNVVASVNNSKVAVLHGNFDSGIDYAAEYGNFKSAFTSPETPLFISQPFGKKEYDLFYFESLDDGQYASDKYKISISNLRASDDPTNKFGTFTVTLRDLKDTDEAPIIYESYSNCSLNPDSVNYIGRIIGDEKIYYAYQNSNEDERRLVREGTFKNVSTRIRVIVSDDVVNREIPEETLPFGFRGVPALLLNSSGKDNGQDANSTKYVHGDAVDAALVRSVMPPLPYRFKITKGSMKTGASWEQTFTGEASDIESVDLNLYWGLMTERVENIENPNSSNKFNHLITNYLKFLSNSSIVWSKEKADSHNNNKFSLSKISLGVQNISDVSGTINDVFKNAAYIRNADASNESLYDSSSHLINLNNTNDALTSDSSKVSLAKLLAESPLDFNKYNLVAKFTAPFYGGFDGLNIFDTDSYYMTDRALTVDSTIGGKAGSDGFDSALSGTTNAAMQGANLENNLVASYRNAIRLMTDDMVVNHNVFVLPGIRDKFITDYVKQRIESYGKALYVMDIEYFDKFNTRIFIDEKGKSSSRPDVETTSEAFDAREINSSYVASYFPDAMVSDSGDSDEAATSSRRSIKVPSSIVALGALAKTDSISSPWFAPAGFSRGALETITSIDVRLNAEDRDTLYEARINPIANFPNKQFVIFGQKTSQLARTSLDRVNVRRLVLEVKRRIELIAQRLLFEQNNSATRKRFIAEASDKLVNIQAGQGIEDFRVIMDETNNTSEDVDNNRLNGKIVIVPTRAVEFIAIDFVITNAGVEFP